MVTQVLLCTVQVFAMAAVIGAQKTTERADFNWPLIIIGGSILIVSMLIISSKRRSYRRRRKQQ